MKLNRFFVIIFFPACVIAKTVPIYGFAHSFITGWGIKNGAVSILETGETFTTDNKGNFGPISYEVGKPLSLEFKAQGYHTTQTATVEVPDNGLVGHCENITFQVPSNEVYTILSKVIGAKIDDDACHLTTTITAYHKTLADDPQGIEGAKIIIEPKVKTTPFYFDIFKSGPLKWKTNPFTQGLTETSLDGGVAIINLTPREEPYTITAEKPGYQFTSTKFICRKGSFINISPPQSPMALSN